MKEFQDKNGKTWTLDLTLGACKRVKDKTKFDLLQPEKQWDVNDGSGEKASYYERVEEDPYFVLKLVFAACKDSIVDNGYEKLDEDSLFDLFNGESYQNALAAFKEEYEDFFLKIGKPALNKYLKKIDEMTAAKNAILEAKLSVFDTKKLIGDALGEQTSGEQSGDGPEKSASIQED